MIGNWWIKYYAIRSCAHSRFAFKPIENHEWIPSLLGVAVLAKIF